MLTRCKKGMIIITNEVFIRSASVQRTLLGKLCAHWEREYGSGLTWKRFKEIENKSAKLPGSIGEGYDDANGYTYDDDEGCGNNGLTSDKYGYNYHGSRGVCAFLSSSWKSMLINLFSPKIYRCRASR